MSTASETDAKTRCAVAYESAQEARAAGELKRAQENLVVCAQSTCAAFIQSDCSDWLTAVQRDLPSVVFSAKKPSGEESLDATVTLDGQLIAPSLDGRAVSIDPGVHEFEFGLEGFPRVKRRVVIRQGEKNRVVGVVFPSDEADPASEQPGAPVVASSQGSSGRPWAYVAWGVGASALAGAFFLNNSARNQEDEFLDRCDANGDGTLDETPGCLDDDLRNTQDAVDRKLLWSAVSLGTGIAGVVGGTVLFFLTKDAPDDQDAGLQVQIGPRGLGAYASVSASF